MRQRRRVNVKRKWYEGHKDDKPCGHKHETWERAEECIWEKKHEYGWKVRKAGEWDNHNRITVRIKGVTN